MEGASKMKRSSPDSERSSGSGEPTEGEPKRVRLVTFEPVRLPAVCSVVELEAGALAFTNRKLSERLAYRQKMESGLRKRMEQFEERQTQDDALLCLINRHWNRLDEDMHLLLQRFDAETAVEDEAEKEDAATTSFLAQLAQWETEEADVKLRERVEFSRRAAAKLVQTFDRLCQRTQRLGTAIGLTKPDDLKPDPDLKPPAESLEPAVVSLNEELMAENGRLHSLVTQLQQKNHRLSLKHSNYDDQLTALETKMEEKDNSLEEANFQLQKAMQREEKLEQKLSEVWRQLETTRVALATHTSDAAAAAKDDVAAVSRGRADELEASLEEAQELAASRLTQLHQLKDSNTASLVALEAARMELRNLPSSLITSSAEYVSLQSAFSVLHSEAARIREHAEGLRGQLIASKAEQRKQIEQMEAEELLAQKQLRHEMIQLEEQLSQVRREYEMLRLEFEQNLAANEQSGPVNREMRQLLGSCKTQIDQLKSEGARYKKKWKDAISTIAKIHKELEVHKKLRDRSIVIEVGEAEAPDLPATPEEDDEEEPSDPTPEWLSESRRKLRGRLGELQERLRSIRALGGEETERASVADRLSRFRREVATLKTELAAVGTTTEKAERDKERHFADDAVKRIRHLEEQNEKLKKEAASAKAEEDTLMNEMDVTGQAFEEMQEQNARLLQHLKEKDDANFKLMSERIRWNQQQKKLKEETELREEEVGALTNQVEAQNLVVRKLEEKERLLAGSIGNLEKELGLRHQAVELSKRKALEFAQSSADLRLQVEKLTSQLRDTTEAVTGKTATLGDQSFKMCRLQEELSAAKKGLERARKMERMGAGAVDEVLLEEIKEYKSQLTCSSCKVNKKDGLLTKCNHVFCMDCITKRYELRKRKCPHCQAAFGANDYRRIYIF